MRLYRTIIPFATCILASAIAAQVTHAQTGGMLEETIVTAEKRVSTIQNTPIAVSAFSGAELERGLINNVLDFSKMDATKLLLSSEEFDLERTLTEIMMLFQPAVLQKDLELLLDYDMFLPTHFIGDEGRVRQILTNLMGNSVKFTDSGHVLVRVVGLPNGETNEMRIHITIEDTGCGIPENMVEPHLSRIDIVRFS